MLERRRKEQIGVLVKVFVALVDARIDHRPYDVFAIRRERCVRCIGFDGCDGVCEKRLDLRVFPDSIDRASRRC